MADKLISQAKAVSIINRMVELPTETRAKVIAAINRVEEAGQKWIPVTERLPENHQKVLAFKKTDSGGYVFLAKRSRENWVDQEWSCYRYGVTHWMPLPEPPKGE